MNRGSQERQRYHRLDRIENFEGDDHVVNLGAGLFGAQQWSAKGWRDARCRDVELEQRLMGHLEFIVPQESLDEIVGRCLFLRKAMVV